MLIQFELLKHTLTGFFLVGNPKCSQINEPKVSYLKNWSSTDLSNTLSYPVMTGCYISWKDYLILQLFNKH